jgi:glycosyltransferase involved in cell wall biosynthesis
MKILLLNLYYPPDTSATAKMAQTVVEALSSKHEVTVLCGRPSYEPTERRAWRLFRTERVGRVRVIRTGSTDFPRKDMKKRVLNYLSYAVFAVPRALFVECDVVLAMTDPPFEGIVGAFIAMLKDRPYVYNIRDMYPDMAVGGAIVEPGLFARVWERMHRWALRRAKRVIVLGEDMRARIIGKGVDGSRVVVVRDGAEIPSPDATLPVPDAHVVRAIRGNSSFVLLHAGNLGFYGAWNTLITAARKLASEGVGLVFVGDGAQRAEMGGCRGRGKHPFLGFLSGEQDSIGAGGCGRAHHHGEAGSGGRGGTQQNVRNPCGRETHRGRCPVRDRCGVDRGAARICSFRRSGQSRGTRFSNPSAHWRHSEAARHGPGGAGRGPRL